MCINCMQHCLRNPFYDNSYIFRCTVTSALSTVASRGTFVFNWREDLCETHHKTTQFPQMNLNLINVLSQLATKSLGFLKSIFCLKYFEEF